MLSMTYLGATGAAGEGATLAVSAAAEEVDSSEPGHD